MDNDDPQDKKLQHLKRSDSDDESGEGGRKRPGTSSIEPERKKVVGVRKDGRKYVEKNSLNEEELREERDRIRAALKQKKKQAESGDAEDAVSRDDVLADRRAANRLSAFQSRQRRKRITQELQTTVTDLSKVQGDQAREIDTLKEQLAAANAEKDRLQQIVYRQQPQQPQPQYQGGAGAQFAMPAPPLQVASAPASGAPVVTNNVVQASPQQHAQPSNVNPAQLLQQLLAARQQQQGVQGQPTQQQGVQGQPTQQQQQQALFAPVAVDTTTTATEAQPLPTPQAAQPQQQQVQQEQTQVAPNQQQRAPEATQVQQVPQPPAPALSQNDQNNAVLSLLLNQAAQQQHTQQQPPPQQQPIQPQQPIQQQQPAQQQPDLLRVLLHLQQQQQQQQQQQTSQPLQQAAQPLLQQSQDQPPPSQDPNAAAQSQAAAVSPPAQAVQAPQPVQQLAAAVPQQDPNQAAAAPGNNPLGDFLLQLLQSQRQDNNNASNNNNQGS